MDIARSKVLGDVPILCIAWGAPKIGNRFVAKWVESQHPRLRNLRIRGANDVVAMLPPNWLFNFINGGYQHFGTEIILSNEHLRKGGLVMDGEPSSSAIYGVNVVMICRQIEEPLLSSTMLSTAVRCCVELL